MRASSSSISRIFLSKLQHAPEGVEALDSNRCTSPVLGAFKHGVYHLGDASFEVTYLPTSTALAPLGRCPPALVGVGRIVPPTVLLRWLYGCRTPRAVPFDAGANGYQVRLSPRFSSKACALWS
jgi:hypothetical protein